MADALSDFVQLSNAFGNMAGSLINLLNVKVETEVNRRQAEIGKLQTDFLMRMALPPGAQGRIGVDQFQQEFNLLNERINGYIDSVQDSVIKGKVQNILTSNSNAFKLKVAEKYGEALYNEAMNNYFVTNSIQYEQASPGKKEEVASKFLEWGRVNMDPSQFKRYEHEILTKARADDALYRASLSDEDLVRSAHKESDRLDEASKAELSAKVQAITDANDKNIDQVMKDNEKGLNAGTISPIPLIQSVRENKNLSLEKKSAVIDQLKYYYSQNMARSISSEILQIGFIPEGSGSKWRTFEQIKEARALIDQRREEAEEVFKDSTGGIPEPFLSALNKAEDEVDTWEKEASEGREDTTNWWISQWNSKVQAYNARQISGYDLWEFLESVNNANQGALYAKFKEQILDKTVITSDAHREVLRNMEGMFKRVSAGIVNAKKGLYLGIEYSDKARDFLRKMLKDKIAEFESHIKSMAISAEARYLSGKLKSIEEVEQDIAKYMLVYAEAMGNIGTIAKERLSGADTDIGKVLEIAEGKYAESFSIFENENIFGQTRGKIAEFSKLEEQIRQFGIIAVTEALSAETLPPDALKAFKETNLIESKDTSGKMDTAFESKDGKYRIDVNAKSGGGVVLVLSKKEGNKWVEISRPGRVPDTETKIVVDPLDPESVAYKRWNGRTKSWETIDKETYYNLRGNSMDVWGVP